MQVVKVEQWKVLAKAYRVEKNVINPIKVWIIASLRYAKNITITPKKMYPMTWNTLKPIG